MSEASTAALFRIRQADPEQRERAMREQRAKGKSEAYARAFADKIHEGETFARYFAELRSPALSQPFNPLSHTHPSLSLGRERRAQGRQAPTTAASNAADAPAAKASFRGLRLPVLSRPALLSLSVSLPSWAAAYVDRALPKGFRPRGLVKRFGQGRRAGDAGSAAGAAPHSAGLYHLTPARRRRLLHRAGPLRAMRVVPPLF
jgi:hypothetical protein